MCNYCVIIAKKVSCVAAAAAAHSSVILQSVSVGWPQFVQPPDQLCVQVLISRGPCMAIPRAVSQETGHWSSILTLAK